MSKIEVVLCNPVRTAIGTYGGSAEGHARARPRAPRRSAKR